MSIAGADTSRILQLLLDNPEKYKADIEAYYKAEKASLDAVNLLIDAQNIVALRAQVKQDTQKAGELLSKANNDAQGIVSRANSEATVIVAKANGVRDSLMAEAAVALNRASEKTATAEATYDEAKAILAEAKSKEADLARAIEANKVRAEKLEASSAEVAATKERIGKASRVMQEAIGG
jgi:hypothetical protein